MKQQQAKVPVGHEVQAEVRAMVSSLRKARGLLDKMVGELGSMNPTNPQALIDIATAMSNIMKNYSSVIRVLQGAVPAEKEETNKDILEECL